MLNFEEYNNQKLDKNTRDQLFQLFVENKFKEIENKIGELKKDFKFFAEHENLATLTITDILEKRIETLEEKLSARPEPTQPARETFFDWIKSLKK